MLASCVLTCCIWDPHDSDALLVFFIFTPLSFKEINNILSSLNKAQK